MQLCAIVEEVKAKIEKTGGDGFTVDKDMGFFHVPAARAHDHDGDIVLQRVGLAAGLIGEGQIAIGEILHVHLAVDHVCEGR